MMDTLSGSPKLPKNGINYFAPKKLKNHAIEGKTLYYSLYSVKQQDDEKKTFFTSIQSSH